MDRKWSDTAAVFLSGHEIQSEKVIALIHFAASFQTAQRPNSDSQHTEQSTLKIRILTCTTVNRNYSATCATNFSLL